MADSLGKVGEAFVDIIGKLGPGFDKSLRDAEATMGSKLKSIGGGMKSVGKKMSMSLTMPIVALGAAVIKVGGDFERGMNRVEGISGATGKQFEALKNQAKELGRTTMFSAKQAADAMGFLAMAGFEADEIIGSMPATLNLAAAAQMDLAQSADIVSNIMTGYGLSVDEIANATDVLVKTTNSANTDLSQLGEAFKYVAPIASAAGLEFEQVNAALGLLGNAGIQASMAGTSLRGAMNRLLNPSTEVVEAMGKIGLKVKDANDQLLPLDRIIEQLEPHANDAGLMLKLFGRNAGPAMAGLVKQGSEKLRDLTDDLRNAGGEAKKMADINMKGVHGAMLKLKSAVEGLLIAIGESGLLDFIAKLATKLATFVGKLAETNPELLKWGTVIAGAAAAIGPLLVALGAVVVAVGALAPIAGSIGIVAAAAAGLGAVGATIYAAWDVVGPKLIQVWNTIKTAAIDIWEGIKGVVMQAMAELTAFFESDLGQGIIAAWKLIWAVASDVVSTAFTIVGKVLKAALGVIQNAIKIFGGLLTADWRKVWDGLKGIVVSVGKGIWEVLKSVFVGILQIVQDTLTMLVERLKSTLGLLPSIMQGPILGALKGMTALQGGVGTLIQKLSETKNAVDEGFVGPIKKAGDEAEKAADKTKKLPPPLVALGEGFGAAGDEADEGGKKVKTAVDSMVDSFKKAQDPTGDLFGAIEKLLAEGFSKTQIVDAWKEKIKAAAAAHIEINGKLEVTSEKLEEVLALANALPMALDTGIQSLDDAHLTLDRVNQSFDSLAEKPQVVGDAVLELNKDLAAMQEEVGQLETDLGMLGGEMDTDEKIIAKWGSRIKAAGDHAKQFGLTLGPNTQRLYDQVLAMEAHKKQAEKGKEAAKAWQTAWATAVGKISAELADALVNMEFSSKKFADNMKGIFKELGKSLLKIMINNTFMKLLGKMEGIPGIGWLFKGPGGAGASGGGGGGLFGGGGGTGGGGIFSGGGGGSKGGIGGIIGNIFGGGGGGFGQQPVPVVIVGIGPNVGGMGGMFGGGGGMNLGGILGSIFGGKGGAIGNIAGSILGGIFGGKKGGIGGILGGLFGGGGFLGGGGGGGGGISGMLGGIFGGGGGAGGGILGGLFGGGGGGGGLLNSLLGGGGGSSGGGLLGSLFGGGSGSGGLLGNLLGGGGKGTGGLLGALFGKTAGLGGGGLTDLPLTLARGQGVAGNFGKVGGILSKISKGFGGALAGLGLGGAIGGMFGEKGGLIGSIGGGVLGALFPALMTNPFTAIGGAALMGGKALYSWLKNPNRVGSKEVKRDFGVDVGKSVIGDFMKQHGLTDVFKKDRKSVLSSPLFLQQVLLPAAQAQGQVGNLAAAFGNLQAFGKTHDLSQEVIAASKGNFEAFNKKFVEIFGKMKDGMGEVMKALVVGNQNVAEPAETTAENTGATAENTGSTTDAVNDLEGTTAEGSQKIVDELVLIKELWTAFTEGFIVFAEDLMESITLLQETLVSGFGQLGEALGTTIDLSAGSDPVTDSAPGTGKWAWRRGRGSEDDETTVDVGAAVAGGGPNVTIIVQAFDGADAERAVRDKIAPALDRMLNHGSRGFRARWSDYLGDN
jgi:TP901 family phage tail tape measure protein